jgi:hypothetical protein
MLIQTDIGNVRHIVDDVAESVGFYTRHLAFSVISNSSGSSMSESSGGPGRPPFVGWRKK